MGTDRFPPCPYCNVVPILNTDSSTFVELVCGCEGEALQIDLMAEWMKHITPPREEEEWLDFA